LTPSKAAKTENRLGSCRVTAVVPAHNEAARVGPVIEALKGAHGIDRIIVVDDGSCDNTFEVASSFDGVVVERLNPNRGKGGALVHGALLASDADILVFLDGDLIGLRPDHVEHLMEPVRAGVAAMAIGQFQAGRGITDVAQALMPYIGGQRAIRRELFLGIPNLDNVGYGIEMAITFHVRSCMLPVRMVPLRGVTHPMKEEKLGFMRGVLARVRMYAQMVRYSLRYVVGSGRQAESDGAQRCASRKNEI
jgi:glycosyltransferase involved in cell wall biosynthesis